MEMEQNCGEFTFLIKLIYFVVFLSKVTSLGLQR